MPFAVNGVCEPSPSRGRCSHPVWRKRYKGISGMLMAPCCSRALPTDAGAQGPSRLDNLPLSVIPSPGEKRCEKEMSPVLSCSLLPSCSDCPAEMGSWWNIDWCLESSASFVRMASQVTDTERPFLGVQHMKQCLPNLSLKSSVQRNIVCLVERGNYSAFSTGEVFFFSNNPPLLSRFRTAFLMSEAVRFKLNWDIVCCRQLVEPAAESCCCTAPPKESPSLWLSAFPQPGCSAALLIFPSPVADVLEHQKGRTRR